MCILASSTMNRSTILAAHPRNIYGVLIGNGGYTPEVASGLVAGGACELVAFGKLFLANSDLVGRLRDDLPLAEYSRAVLDTLV